MKNHLHKKAFTLAEVLIVLAIIGIVAAITIPAMINSTQDNEYHTVLKKYFSA
jgi:prepilin-type N-terminal cleavage/methylation domain-containing protein